MRTVYPTGTTLFKPDFCFNGVTLFFYELEVTLIDMNGRIVNTWQLETEHTQQGTDRAHLQKNGNIVVSRGDMHSTDGLIQEYDWQHNLVWEFIPEGNIPHKRLTGPHHDVWRKENGNTLVICREPVPPEHLKEVREPRWQNQTICGDTILEVDPSGNIVWHWNSHGHLDINHYRLLASPDWLGGPYNSTIVDWTHVNTVRDIPPNKWYEGGDQRFKPGNVIISPRQLDTVYIIDRESGEIVWQYSGDYRGGLSGQHEPHMIPKGCPGDGNILIFDNGASPWKDLGHAGTSLILEVNPVTKEPVWVYENMFKFNSTYASSAQRLPNGNTLICESAGGRVFEVTIDKETVWEHVRPTHRSYRYSYDFCPQLAQCGKPKDVSVTPPEDFRIDPDAPLE